MPTHAAAEPTIKIDGTKVSAEFMDALVALVVNTDLHMPGMFTIELDDTLQANALKWADDASLALGKAVEISIKSMSQDDLEQQTGTLIKGEITGLEPHFRADGQAKLVIRGYDKSHRLHRGKKTRTFQKVKDSDLASRLAQEAGLTAETDATSIEYEYILQHNQTNMEFLRARAERIGYRVFSADGKLYFKKGSATLGDGPELEWGINLKNFQPRLTTAHQADKATTTGWDPKTKAGIVGTATPSAPANQAGVTKSGGAAAKDAFGASAEAVVVDDPVATVNEANDLAAAVGDGINSEFLRAEGVCFGDPRVQAGMVVEITGVGTKFSGKYLVTSATHTYSRGVYETRFGITGQRPDTINHLLEPGNGNQRGRVYGVVTGVVTNISDNDSNNALGQDLGRVKVKFPWLPKVDGTEIDSTWARLASPMAGAERGFFYLPEVNDEVLVAFEHGDTRFPYVIGTLWNTKDKPPLPNSTATKDGKVIQRIIKSRSGHVIILNDEDGKEQIVIRDKTEKNEIVIDSKENTITLRCEKDLKIEAKGKVDFGSTQDDLTIKCKNLKIETQQNCDIKATQNLGLKATSQCTLEGTAGLTLKGAPPAQIAMSGSVNVNNGALEVM